MLLLKRKPGTACPIGVTYFSNKTLHLRFANYTNSGKSANDFFITDIVTEEV